MTYILKHIKGDKGMWAIIIIFSIISFLPIYSASTNLIYVVGNGGDSLYYLIKHAVQVSIGIVLLFCAHRIPYGYYKRYSKIIISLLLVLLLYTFFKGTVIGGADASRWMTIPILNISLQPSLLALIGVMIYVTAYLANTFHKKPTFKEALLKLWSVVGISCILILRSNLSTTAILFMMVVVLAFIGGHPIKHIFKIIMMGVASLVLFIVIAKLSPGLFSNRVDTWESRIESFMGEGNSDDSYQVERAKMAIASTGILTGKGPGKSVMKNFLPQSSSDFIFAIIIEEYGSFWGGACLMFLYMLLFFRIVTVFQKAETPFAKLLVIGMALPIITQTLVNMAVAVNIFPVTGQNLPLLSNGGTSILSTYIALGIILSVSAKRQIDNVTEENSYEEENETEPITSIA